jgi:hypothetical protein
MPEITLAKKSRMVLLDFLNAAAFWAADEHFLIFHLNPKVKFIMILYNKKEINKGLFKITID